MTLPFWTDLWFDWLLWVLVSWVVLEGLSLVVCHLTHQRHIQDWTLSDTIRRWSKAHRWLAPVAVGVTLGLLFHFFLMANPA